MRGRWLTIGALLLTTGVAHATAIPSTAAPGAIERNVPTQPLARPAAPDVTILPPPSAQAPEGADAIKFDLRQVAIDGSSVFSTDELAFAWQRLVGRKVSLSELYGAANAITSRYVQAGYALSFAIVPAQQISSGIVHIRVVEGYVAQISYENGTHDLPPVLRLSYVRHILRSKPLRTLALEHYLLLANDIPGYGVKAVFTKLDEPSAPIGATQLILRITHTPYGAMLAIDNRGARAFGSWRATAAVGLYSPFGIGETLELQVMHSLTDSSLFYYGGQISVPVNPDGAWIQFATSYSHTKPSVLALGSGVFAGNAAIDSIEFDEPWGRGRALSLWTELGLVRKSLNGDIFGTPNSRDRIYEVTLGAHVVTNEPDSRTDVRVKLVQGLPIFGATSERSFYRSRQSGSGTFMAGILDISDIEQIDGPFQAALSLHAQGASRALLSSEECALGGASYGRAFDESALVGDDCLLGSAEMDVALTPLLDLPVPDLEQTQFYAYCDAGILWNNGQLLPAESRSNDAESCGAGLRENLSIGVSGSLEYALPVSSMGGGGRWFTAIRYGL